MTAKPLVPSAPRLTTSRAHSLLVVLVRCLGPICSGYDVLRFLLAALLLTAAALKTHQVATEPILGTGLLDSRWLLMATVEFELALGLSLLFNIYARRIWQITLACFALFTCVSVYKALSGQASCGCFGRVEVNPWYTTTLDLAAVLTLLWWRPFPVLPLPPDEKENLSECHARALARRLHVIAVSVLWLAVGLPAAVAMGTYQPAILAEDGLVAGEGNFVILEPEKWIGKQFPLLPFIEDVPGQLQPGERPLRERLAEGEWLVVLYHHDCPKCQEELRKYRELARNSAAYRAAPCMALIELPPCGDVSNSLLSAGASCAFGRLCREKQWLVETPVALSLRSALVRPAVPAEERFQQVALRQGLGPSMVP